MSSEVAGADAMQSVVRLLEEHQKMMTAHSVPPLKRFIGEDTPMKEVSITGLTVSN